MSKRPHTSPSHPSSASPQDELNHIPLLKILSSADRQRVLQDLTEQRYTKRDTIFREGDPTEYFHIVKEGTVKCVKSSPEGKECTLKMLMPGDLFCCDAAAFEGALHPGTAQPMGDVSILRMNKKSYFEMLRRNPEAAIEVIKHLGNRLNEAQEKAKVLALDRAELAHQAEQADADEHRTIQLGLGVEHEVGQLDERPERGDALQRFVQAVGVVERVKGSCVAAELGERPQIMK